MPFKSLAQKAYLKHNDPEVYRRWVKKYGEGEDLPKRVAEKMTRKHNKK